KSSEKTKRQTLRSNMPPAEKILWDRIRARQIENCKFRRQYSIGPFVTDFYAPELKLAIELDGESHFVEDAQTYDQERDAFLISKGSTIIRVANEQIYQDLDSVLVAIAQRVKELRHLCKSEIERSRVV
ncbi:MAG: endonuclease domain-containing protein, partial [Elainellaceae cyanobacterium]